MDENYVEMTERHKRERAARRSRWRSALNWWTIEPQERDEELAGYNSPVAARKVSVYLIFGFTFLSIWINGSKEDGIDPLMAGEWLLYAICAVFIWQGHRWAIIGAMVLWTIDEGVSIYDSATIHHHPNVGILFWWAVLMAPLWRAFKTEQVRNAPLEQ